MKRNQVLGKFGRGSIRAVLLATAPVVLVLPTPSAAWAQTQSYSFDIASQPLGSALLSLGRQADVSMLAATLLVEGKTGPAVRGQMTLAAALDLLLEDTGLAYVFVQSNAVRIIAKDHAQNGLPSTILPAGKQLADESPGDSGRDNVIITGTNIRGARPASSRVDTYTAKDIQKSGAVTTEQFAAKIPQNLGTFSQYAPGASTAGANADAVSSVDLRGLGVGTTLTLVNGRRVSLSNGGRSADISLIPAAALERVEVLTDGASAIYGSDAIGGVINFILRDDFEGAETRLSYGGVTEGGLKQADASQTFGLKWAGGHGLASYNYHAASALKTSDRSYATAAGPGNLTPTDTRHHVFLTGSQDFGERFTLNADFGQSWRKVKNGYSNLSSANRLNHAFIRYGSESDQVFGSLGLDYRLSDRLTADLSVAYSEIDTDGFSSNVRFNRVPPPATMTNYGSRNSQLDVMAKIGGSLWTLPGGDVRFSAGAGQLEEEFKGISPITIVQSAGTLGRISTYAFAEVWAPVVGSSQDIPLVHSLEFSLAARYTDYKDESDFGPKRDFGDSVDPKAGFAWEPVEALRVRGTYGRSFRAPSLTQLDRTGGSHFLFEDTVAGQGAVILSVVNYSEADLSAETGSTYTFGVDFEPFGDTGLRLGATYYNIDYKDRIDVAPQGGLDPFATPNLLPDVIYRPPSAAYIEKALTETRLLANATSVSLADPAAAAAALFARPDVWVYDNRFRNLALSKQEGIDFNASQSFATAWGDISLGASITHILKYDQQGSATSTVFSASDIPGGPADWRGRINAGFSNGPLNANLGVNFVDDYRNPSAPVGQQTIGSWSTVDLALSYDFGASGEASPLNGTRFSLSVQNLFNSDPPRLGSGVGSNIVYPVGFDPANANPLGTLVVLGASKTW